EIGTGRTAPDRSSLRYVSPTERSERFMSDFRVLRDRPMAVEKTTDRIHGHAPDAAAAILAQTTTVSTYPAIASAFYACIPTDIDGNESEGASATYVQEGAAVFYAWNAGTQIPPSGTAIVCHAVGGRWVFRYDG